MHRRSRRPQRGVIYCRRDGRTERPDVSVRATEKLLAGARFKLGARNNAQAVYRAMVYRGLV
jgi:hypothetical protein